MTYFVLAIKDITICISGNLVWYSHTAMIDTLAI